MRRAARRGLTAALCVGLLVGATEVGDRNSRAGKAAPAWATADGPSAPAPCQEDDYVRDML